MHKYTGFLLLLLFLSFTSAIGSTVVSQTTEGKTINDYNFKFTMKLPAEWDTKDLKETTDKDGISYSLERSDKKMTLMILAFKLSSVKNIDDFIYNLENDISLNMPQKSGELTEKDFGEYDMKNGIYKDDKYYETVYYYRTKLPDAPYNYVYMVRFITESINQNSDVETHINGIVTTFTPTAE